MTKTVTIPDNEVRSFQRSVALAGGHIVRSSISGRGYTVTYTIR